MFFNKDNFETTVKVGYNEQLGTDQICLFITGVRYNPVVLCGNGVIWNELFVRYNWVFVITEFVITEFHYTLIDSGSYQFRSYLSFNIKWNITVNNLWII